MKKENILTYNDAEKARKDGDDECAAYHDDQANECSRVIAKLRAFVF